MELKADYVATMDVDLQDPPSLLPQMLDIAMGGEYDTVATRRVTRKGEPKIRSLFARLFYKLINRISDTEIVDGARDYRMMPRRMVESLVSMKEVNRFSKGLFSWVGFRTKWLEYENVERAAGETKWSFWKLFRYSIDGIVSFSTLPLSIASVMGVITCVAAFVYLVFIIVKTGGSAACIDRHSGAVSGEGLSGDQEETDIRGQGGDVNSRMLTGTESKTKRILPVSFAAFLITLCLMSLILWINGCAPFSEGNSLAINDASIQYLDFHKYWKNVLDGNDSIEYSFGKTLGGSAIAVFSYYLASPFSLLVHLFDPEDFNVFFDLAVALKISLAASFMCLFLLFRYERLKSMMALCLGLSYGIMQYNISQASNIMWLDGAYMLPLIFLSTYQMLRNGTSLLLVVSAALSILFNWYTGCINCLFSALYFLYEFVAMGKHAGFVGFLKAGIVFGSHLLFSVALSSFLFFPSLASLSTGGRGNVQLNSLSFSFLGNPLTAISCLAIGCTSSRGSVSLYCGVLPVVGLLGLFLSNAVSRKEKIVTFLSLMALLLIFYWGPLFWLFSLLVDVSSFYSRYSYGGIFFIILFAGKYFSLDDNRIVRTVLLASVIYIYVHFYWPTA